MADLRTTDSGGGEGGHDPARIAEDAAAWAFERLAVEMLRGIARGGESSCPVGSALRGLYGHLTTDGVRLFPAMGLGLQAVNDRLTPTTIHMTRICVGFCVPRSGSLPKCSRRMDSPREGPHSAKATSGATLSATC